MSQAVSDTVENNWDILIRNALVFDGSGELPVQQDVAVADGCVVARAASLTGNAQKEIDATGRWLTPGLLDIHTHFDLELELAPGLPEALRHGTTTVVVANCSLGLAYGNQREAGVDPIVDCFARVENIPKPVLARVADKATWDNSADYLTHLNELPLGVNIVPLIPHSMLRIQVMGFNDSITRDPTEDELEQMRNLLDTAMQEGYAGFSTDALPYHYLANDPNRRAKIPTQYGSYRELKLLTSVLREHDRVWQATPPKDNPLEVFRNFLLTSERLHKKPLKITAVAALDVAANRGLLKLTMILVKVLNSSLLKGKFAIQALAAPFKIWGEGPITPVFEEVDELRLLIEPDLEDREGRRQVLDDPEFVHKFKRMWSHGKSGFSLARLKRLLVREDYAFTRNLSEMVIDSCPVASWAGWDLLSIYQRAQRFQQGHLESVDEQERASFSQLPDNLNDEGLFFLELLKQFDTDLYWHSTIANRDPETTLNTLLHPKILPGFNDSGAHLTNMAFYDGNLRGLQAAKTRNMESVAHLVKRLTRDPAEFFGIDAGTLEIGARADLTLIDPQALESYNSEAATQSIYREEFANRQLVNRSDGVVTHVLVAGNIAWQNGSFTPEHGKRRWGQALKAVG